MGPGVGSPEKRPMSPRSTWLTGALCMAVKRKSFSSSGNGQKELPDLSLLTFQWEKERAILFPHQWHKLLGSHCPPCTQHSSQTFPTCCSSAPGHSTATPTAVRASPCPAPLRCQLPILFHVSRCLPRLSHGDCLACNCYLWHLTTITIVGERIALVSCANGNGQISKDPPNS